MKVFEEEQQQTLQDKARIKDLQNQLDEIKAMIRAADAEVLPLKQEAGKYFAAGQQRSRAYIKLGLRIKVFNDRRAPLGQQARSIEEEINALKGKIRERDKEVLKAVREGVNETQVVSLLRQVQSVLKNMAVEGRVTFKLDEQALLDEIAVALGQKTLSTLSVRAAGRERQARQSQDPTGYAAESPEVLE